MYIEKLSVQHIRSHDSRLIELSPHTTVITGRNGAGKTTLLEAVYVMFRGTSFKGTDTELLTRDQQWWRIDGKLPDEEDRTVTFDTTKDSGKKTFTVRGQKSHRLLPKHRYPIVLFEPDDIRLLHGSPARRRKFIDHLINQIDPQFTTIVSRYERALRQRNNLLKQQYITPEMMFAWNVTLSEYGAQIIERRVAFLEQINHRIQDAYQAIAKTNDAISVHYSHTSIDQSAQKLLREFEASLQKDIIVGHTSVGPHRHDVEFLFNAQPAAKVTSRGEARSIILALKQIEEDIILKTLEVAPMVLLDDAFSELDSTRQTSLSQFQFKGQTIITSATHALESKQAVIVAI